MGRATVIMDPTVAKLLKDIYGFKTKDQLSKWFSENIEKKVYPNAQTTTHFPESSINIIVTGGGGQTTWFVTDFALSRNMVSNGGSTLIDDWR